LFYFHNLLSNNKLYLFGFLFDKYFSIVSIINFDKCKEIYFNMKKTICHKFFLSRYMKFEF